MRRWQGDESGKFIIIGAILLPVLVGTVGAAITYSNTNGARTSLQASLDAAVLSGAIALGNGQDAVTTAQNFFRNDLDAHAKTTMTQIVTTSTVNAKIVSGQASGSYSNPFAGVIGANNIRLTVTSGATEMESPLCVLGLDTLANGSFDVNGQPQFNADCAVQANTTSTTGMTQEGTAHVVATKSALPARTKRTIIHPHR